MATERAAAPAEMSRSSFLRLGALSALGAGSVAAGVAGQAQPAAAAGSGPAFGAARVERLGRITGLEITGRFGAGFTDLGITTLTPDGRILALFGDTWDKGVFSGDWRSPIGLYATRQDPMRGKLAWESAVGGNYARQLVPYTHGHEPALSTIFPIDVLTVGDTIYLWVMLNHGFGKVGSTEMWTSRDNGATWKRHHLAPGDALGHRAQQGTMCLNPKDGFVYVLSKNFKGTGMILRRVRPEKLTDFSAYESWGFANGKWAWGNPPSFVLTMKARHVNWRVIDGVWVLTMFLYDDPRIDMLLLEDPLANMFEAPRRTILRNAAWDKQGDALVTSLYGGHIIPGSTRRELHLVASQWVKGKAYHSEQFRITDVF